MSELMNDSQLPTLEAEDEAPVQYFCKFTFAQFFTIMILAVFTLGFMFYLGARYGNDYLRLGQAEPAVTSAPVVSSFGTSTTDPARADEMLATAREALQQQQAEKLQGEIQQQPGVVSVYSQQTQQVPPGAVAPGAVPGVVPGAAPVVQPAMDPAMQPTVPTTTVQTAGSERVNDYEPGMNQQPQQAIAQPQQAQVVYPQQAPQAMPQPQSIPQNPSLEDESVATIPAKSAGIGTFSVQVAASQDMNEANQWVQGWRDKGYSAYMLTAEIPQKGRWYRVRLGTFPSRETAETFASQLKEKENVQAIAVQNE